MWVRLSQSNANDGFKDEKVWLLIRPDFKPTAVPYRGISKCQTVNHVNKKLSQIDRKHPLIRCIQSLSETFLMLYITDIIVF